MKNKRNIKKIKEESFEKQKTEILKKIQRLDEIKLKRKLSEEKIQEIEHGISEKEEVKSEDELEEIVSRTPSLRVQKARDANPFLEASGESQQETRLETQIQEAPAPATAPTRTETENSQRYVANMASYTTAAGYDTSRGNYEGTAGYPEQIKVRDLRLEQPAPFLEQSPFGTSPGQRIVKPWMDQMQSPGPQAMEQPEQKKYEPMDERKRRRIL